MRTPRWRISVVVSFAALAFTSYPTLRRAPGNSGAGFLPLFSKTEAGVARGDAPGIYREAEPERMPVRVGRQVLDGGHPAGSAGEIIAFSTYLGGSSFSSATGIAVDGSGNIYVTGWTESAGFPVKNALQSGFGGDVDAFVAKFDPTGSTLLYCTFLGGAGDDRSFGIAVDNAGSAYITGWTYSTNFPTAGSPAQAGLSGGRDAFVAKLSPAGDQLVYSTYLGGSGNDAGLGIAVDSAGNAYVTGETTSSNFPTLRPLQSRLNGIQNGFVSMLDGAGRLLFGTYLGGSGTDSAAAIAVDSTGSAYVTGSTDSTNFPTVNAFQSANGGYQDAFVAKLGPNGSSLVYSTYLGGSGGVVGYPESGLGIDVDANGSAYVAGVTSSPNFPLQNPFQSTLQGWLNAFVAKLSATGNALVYSTYLGGSSLSSANAVRVSSTGAACVAGDTTSTDFPLLNSLQTGNAGPPGSYDAFLSCLTTSGNALSFSTLLGGSGNDTTNGLAMDALSIYMAGQTASGDFPLVSAFQPVNQGGQSAFVTRFWQPPPPPVPALPENGATGVSVTPALSWNASSGATSYSVYLGNSSSPPLAAITNGTSYSPNTLAAGTTYYWQVAAGNSAGSSTSALWSFTTACTYAINLTGVTLGAAGGTGSVAVVAPAGCSWTAAANAPWLAVISGSSGSGNGTVGYSVAANPAGTSRTGTLTIAGQTFTVNQGGVACTYFLSSTSASPDSNGGSGSVTVTAPAGCSWTAAGNAPWLAVISGSSGSGNGTVGYSVVANPAGTSRTGTLTIAWQTFTVTETGVTCTYALSRDAGSAGVGGGNASVTVTAPAVCTWAAVANVAWISVISGASGSGTGNVQYSVAANSSSPRSGSLTIAGQAFTVAQAGNGPSSIPGIQSLTPYSGTGLSQTFTAVYSDTNGWADIALAYFMVNVIESPSDACYIKYDASANALWLIADDAATWQGPIAPGSGSLQNAACTLNGAASWASGSGNNLTVNYAVTFASSYAGERGIYLSAQNFEGNVLDWSPYGSWWPMLTLGSPVNWYRLYVPFNSSHHYTADYNEYTTLGSEGYVEEGAVGQLYNAPFGATLPYYRIYIIPAATHFWTTDRNEYLTLILYRGYYSGEGIAGFLLPTATSGDFPYYRLSYCCATPPIHFWTTDNNEYLTLQTEGWISEGIPGYMLPAQPIPNAQAVPVFSVVSAGSNKRGPVAPGQVIDIYGHDLAQARVSIDGIPAKILSVSGTVAQVVVPDGVAGRRRATVLVEHADGRRETSAVGVEAANPSLFATDRFGKGQAVARLADGTMNSEQNAVAGGEEVVLYATGLGSGLPVSVTVGGHPAELLGVAKVDGRSELRIRVPAGLEPIAAAAVTVRSGEYASQPGVTIFVK